MSILRSFLKWKAFQNKYSLETEFMALLFTLLLSCLSDSQVSVPGSNTHAWTMKQLNLYVSAHMWTSYLEFCIFYYITGINFDFDKLSFQAAEAYFISWLWENTPGEQYKNFQDLVCLMRRANFWCGFNMAIQIQI